MHAVEVGGQYGANEGSVAVNAGEEEAGQDHVEDRQSRAHGELAPGGRLAGGHSAFAAPGGHSI